MNADDSSSKVETKNDEEMKTEKESTKTEEEVKTEAVGEKRTAPETEETSTAAADPETSESPSK